MKSNVFAAAAFMSGVATAAQTSCPKTINPSKAVPMDNLPCGATEAEFWIVQPGEYLNLISSMTGIGVCTIANQNGIQNIDLIQPEQNLTIPVCTQKSDNETCFHGQGGGSSGGDTNTCVYDVHENGALQYLIASGDTFNQIAADAKITPQSLQDVNPQVTDPNRINAGDFLNFPVCPNTSCEIAIYNIKSGDTFATLAHGPVTVGLIKAVNQGVEPTTLQVDQRINLPTNCKPDEQ